MSVLSLDCFSSPVPVPQHLPPSLPGPDAPACVSPPPSVSASISLPLCLCLCLSHPLPASASLSLTHTCCLLGLERQVSTAPSFFRSRTHERVASRRHGCPFAGFPLGFVCAPVCTRRGVSVRISAAGTELFTWTYQLTDNRRGKSRNTPCPSLDGTPHAHMEIRWGHRCAPA